MKKAKLCKSIFKSGETATTQKEITQAFIKMINQLERSKSIVSRAR